MAELDQTARYALKMVPPEVIAWVLPDLDADLRFTRWLDTETIAFPGEPRRRCDTVAELVSRSGQSPPWALVFEVEARPRATILERVLEYELRLFRKLRHGPRKRDRYLVAGVVFFLSGRKKDLKWQMRLPNTDIGSNCTVRPVNLADHAAAGLLERIARGELGRSILPWAPLMQGAASAAVAQEWVRLATQEADAQRRSDYAGLAEVFADWAGHRPIWTQPLEGIVNMWQSQVIREWKDAGRQEARLEERRSALVKVLQKRFPPEIPADLTQMIQQSTDPEQLSRWFDAALDAPSLDAVRNVIQPSPTGTP
jgi:hypothetical protein